MLTVGSNIAKRTCAAERKQNSLIHSLTLTRRASTMSTSIHDMKRLARDVNLA